MPSVKNMLAAAAGAAGGDPIDVTDVFSTYLYEGTATEVGIDNGIALADGLNGGTSTQFDGSDDYLNRSSDLTGNADGKTFTFSAFIFPTAGNSKIYHIDSGGGGTRFQIGMDNSGNDHILRILVTQAGSGSTALYAPNAGTLRLNAWNHILCSFDMANTSNRHVYIDDVAQSVSYSDYVNANLEFTMAQYLTVGGALYSGGAYGLFNGRLAHVFLDYTFRDLSVESTRRTFIDANGGSTSPSTLSALNPIIYLPMTEDYSVGKNLGTGGDFTGNGSPTIVSGGAEYQSGYGQGGLVWVKNRSTSSDHRLFDTATGAGNSLIANDTFGLQSSSGTSFTSTGFGIGTLADFNNNNDDFVSWTWRKAKKWFDIVTYNGNGATQNISHNLGSVPGMIIIKCTSRNGDFWNVYHRSIGNNKRLMLQSTNGEGSAADAFNSTDPTSTQFSVGQESDTNASGQTYVAYLFAHNNSDGGFGPDGDQDIIKCDSYTGNGSSNGTTVNLGFEPQWLLTKRTDASAAWQLHDSMRGVHFADNDNGLRPDATNTESSANYFRFTPTGFKLESSSNTVNGNGGTYAYMAIRRGPLTVPTSVSNVFDIETWTGNNTGSRVIDTDITHDTALLADRANGNYFARAMYSRLTGEQVWPTSSSQPDSYWTGTATRLFHDVQEGIELPTNAAQWNSSSDNFIGYFWKRAPSFFDVVTFNESSAGATVNHNLGVAPKMIWVKGTNINQDWYVYHEDLGNSAFLRINNSGAATTSTNATWNSTSPTATQFTIGGYLTAYEYVAWLFGSVDGVSKVGSYTGNGSSSGPTIDCGFSSGPKWVLIKRATGGSNDNWAIFDTTRGLSSGNDNYMALETNDSEFSNVDWIDPTNAGFQVVQTNSSVNASGSTYIFYAIAA